MLAIALLFQVLGAPSSPVPEGDWPRFRGPNGSGVLDGKELPPSLDPAKCLAWKLDVPPGTSSPVVAGGRLFLTGAEGEERIVLAIDAATGKELWRKSFRRERTEASNGMNGPASPTPAAGGGAVFVFFPEIGLIALEAGGEERWRKPLGPFRSMHGIASSPVFAEGKVLLLIDHLATSYLAAFDAASGKEAWKTERASGVTGGYSSPAVTGTGSEARVIVAGAFELTAYAVSGGERVWWATGLTNAPVGLPVVDEERVYVCEPVGESHPFKEALKYDKDGDGKISRDEMAGEPAFLSLLERIDTAWGNGDGAVEASEFEKAFGLFVGNGGLAAVRLGGKGDVTRTHLAWRQTKGLPYVPSVILYRQTLFAVRDGGILTSFDPATGAVRKQARLEGAEGSYYASPVAGDGKLIFLSESGKVSMVKAQPEWELLSSSDLGERAYATPAISEGRVYLRTGKTLLCLGKN